MKINRTTKYKNKLLNLKLIETKIYKNLKFFDSSKIENTEFSFKRALHVIHKYNTSNKQILFIGTPLELTKKLLQHLFKNTKHIVIPETLWINGALYNKVLNKSTKTYERLLKLKQTTDLIVMLNKTSNITALEEGHKTKITTISLNCNLTYDEFSYKVLGDLKLTQKQIKNNFFDCSLMTVLKRVRVSHNYAK